MRRFAAGGIFCAFTDGGCRSEAGEKHEMDFIQGKLSGVWLIEPKVFEDKHNPLLRDAMTGFEDW